MALAFPAVRSSRLFGAQVSTDLTSLSASQLSAGIKQSQISCVEVMQAYLQRIHRYNPVYNAIVSMADVPRPTISLDSLLREGE